MKMSGAVGRRLHTLIYFPNVRTTKRQRHDRRSEEHAVSNVLIVRVVLERRGQELLERDVHHHSAHLGFRGKG